MYNNLFSPITINQLEIKNRIAYPALGLLYSYDGQLNDRYYNYFREKGAGGAGIITVGPVGIDYIGIGAIGLRLDSDDNIPSFQKLTSCIKEGGARAWVQLFHAGAYSHPILINGENPIAPSPVYSRYSKATPREMTIEDIKTLQKAYVDAASRAVEAGFDGIEILASAGYLITQFLSPIKNRRTDEYGGSFENRTRFPREVLTMVRAKIGKNVPLTIRMAGNDFVPGSNTDSETPEFAKLYESCGVDAINVTGGWHESPVPQLPMEVPRSAYAYLALNIKKVVSLPVMASNRISTPFEAEKIIADGYADMVNLGRILISDPQWPNKAKENRADEIRPCVACSQGCTDQIFSGQPVYCITNPRAGFEGERNVVKTASPKRLMVIGGGPAGLETAVTAAQAGHTVDIYEKSDDIGGQLRFGGNPPNKQEIFAIIRYYKAMIKKLNIPLHLNTEATTDLIKEKNPDHIVVAEGAEALIPPIKGVDDKSVVSSWDVLKGGIRLGKKAAIIGGGAVGLETAYLIASKGTITPEILHFLFAYEAESPERLRELMFKGATEVTVFEMLPKVGKDVGKSTKWVLLGNLDRHGVKILTHSKVTGIKNGVITYVQGDKEVSESFDTVILASGSRPVQKLSKEIEKLGIPYTTIGDCTKIGKIDNAIHGGFLTAINL
ncbi:MAG: FAD-dependent oxidoreductase [Proteobacteria bacterium]|nr:FAD-dependent oxidoreductase [Pseudomonadota bacterium]